MSSPNKSTIENQKPMVIPSAPLAATPMLPAVESRTLRPILFSTPMVQAILEGRKTQTRRILKVKGCKPFVPDNSWKLETIIKWNKDYFPYGKIGDVLWVRETFKENFKENIALGQSNYIFRADGKCETDFWKPSIFMPFKACRLFLKITDIRIERLNDISETDALNEGVQVDKKNSETFQHTFYTNYLKNSHSLVRNAKDSFMTLWFEINTVKSWYDNPFVWVIEFQRCVHP